MMLKIAFLTILIINAVGALGYLIFRLVHYECTYFLTTKFSHYFIHEGKATISNAFITQSAILAAAFCIVSAGGWILMQVGKLIWFWILVLYAFLDEKFPERRNP